MAPSTTSPATLPQPSPHHNPLPYYGTALEPWQTAAMVIARANQDLARRRLVFGSLRRDDLVTEYNWALDRLVTSGVCRLAAPPKVVPADREAWLQTQQQEIEAWVQGQASPDGPRLTETELAQMGLLPARGLPPGLSPHQRPAVQAHLAKLATMPGDFWIGAPMIYAREVLFTVIVRGGAAALAQAELLRESGPAYFWEEFRRERGQTLFNIMARFDHSAGGIVARMADIAFGDPSAILALTYLTAQPTMSFFFFAEGHYDEPLFERRQEWPVSGRQRIMTHMTSPHGRSLVPGVRSSIGSLVDSRTDPSQIDPRWHQTLGLLNGPWQMRESFAPDLPGLDVPAANLYWGELHAGAYIRLSAQGLPCDLSLRQLAEARWGTAPSSVMQAFPGGGKAWRGIVAAVPALPGTPVGDAPPSIRLSFYWQKQTNPLAALRHIAEIETQRGQVVPAPLMAALYVAGQCYSHQTATSQWPQSVAAFLHVFLQFVPPVGGVEAAPPLSQQQLESLLQRWEHGESMTMGKLPANSYSLAQYFWGQARLLWATVGVDLRAQTVAPLDYAYLCSFPVPREMAVEEAGPLRLDDAELPMPTYALARAMWELFTRTGISRPALEHILPGGVVRAPGDQPIDDDLAVQEYVLAHEWDQDELRAWVRDLLLQAQEQGWYVPTGRFRVPVDVAPLREIGISEVRGYIDPAQPQTMWMGLVTPDRRVARIVRWSADVRPDPESALAGWTLVDPALWPVVDFLAAALWRDMVILGAAGFPPADPSRQGPPGVRPAKQHPKAVAPISTPPVHVLPRRGTSPRSRQPWPLTGDPRQWGSPEERRYIQRRGCDVPGLYRVHLYRAERRAAPLQAVLADPPLDLWRERHRAAQRVRNPLLGAELAAWWETMLSAAGAAATVRQPRTIDRVLAVETVLAGQLRRAERENQPRLARWLASGLQALEDAKAADAADLLAEAQEQLQQQRAEAGERAARFVRPAPPAGYTFVRPYARVGTRGEPAEAAVPVIQAKGLLVVQTVLSRQRSNPLESGLDERQSGN